LLTHVKALLDLCKQSFLVLATSTEVSAGARAFKVGEPKFLLILALVKHAVHNALTSINKYSLMQSEIWSNKLRIAFSGAFL